MPTWKSGELPDPGRCDSLDEFATALRRLKVWAGDPSYESIKDRVNGAWSAAGRPAAELAGKSTVADCFRPGRRRLNTDLVLAVVGALHPDPGYTARWRRALRVIGDPAAASRAHVQDRLPRDVPAFTGRDDEVDRIRRAAADRQPVVVISGMAGVGKTGLAVRAGGLLVDERRFDRVLFAALRGFDTDPAGPPADPTAVLGAFLRLLGVPARQLPRDPAGRAAVYRDRLADSRTLVVLDNAADSDQVRPLTATGPGCLTLVTSRRRLTGLGTAAHLDLDVFPPSDAERFLRQAVPAIPVGPDPEALSRIARRCGHLPLALGLVAAHMGGLSGWTLTDHADRLDKRRDDRRLDTAVELALDVSYRHLPPAERHLLRLLALHPGHDFDGPAAAALAGSGLSAAHERLRRLGGDNLLRTPAPDRYAFHDLVRSHAAGRADDEEPPTAQRAALTRLFDHYLTTSAAAVATLFPAESDRRSPPVFTTAADALAWLDVERPALVAVAGHTAARGWPTHTTRLSTTLWRYLAGGHHADAVAIHGHAHQVARSTGDVVGQARASASLGLTHLRSGRYAQAGDHLRRALELFRHTDDRTGRARALNVLGLVEMWLGRYRSATDHHERALALFRQTGDIPNEARVLGNLGHVDLRLGHHGRAGDHHRRALELFRQTGDRRGEAHVLDCLGTLNTRLDRPDRAAEHHRNALALHRENGDREGEAWALNGFGDAARAAGSPAEAITHHTAAGAIAADVEHRQQQARAHTGLGRAHEALDEPVDAGHHYRRALTLYTDLGLPEADRLRDDLVAARL
ncbi:tetratricopeptide repeat protein [Umezawaea sp. Da 62-37]|uniref:tetratricopeptide repeat protein n=1 Tax=Umezawaea sp. Da 62-37 TaxID=3075927 RepID=UPI0028F6C587|nr:tetratricopeptide repeat protein [Umezawaea sp. Da 62-37]WNV86394.1 tetratricopeptide repeat protein [Umezawaea sp. Da 62-37]